MTHYERLGVDPRASSEEVRDAYRRQARVHHPDARGAAGADAMAAINEAYRVLRDPQRRRDYDRQLRVPVEPVAEPGPPPRRTEPAYNPLARYQDPPRFPWRFMAVLAALGIGVVLVGVVTSEPQAERPPDNILTPGSCVVVEANGDAAEVNCSQPHAGVVERIVAFDERCPAHTEGHRDRQGLGIACIVPG